MYYNFEKKKRIAYYHVLNCIRRNSHFHPFSIIFRKFIEALYINHILNQRYVIES
jgi:hypothetical protein